MYYVQQINVETRSVNTLEDFATYLGAQAYLDTWSRMVPAENRRRVSGGRLATTGLGVVTIFQITEG